MKSIAHINQTKAAMALRAIGTIVTIITTR
jgi:hypothetical protein